MTQARTLQILAAFGALGLFALIGFLLAGEGGDKDAVPQQASGSSEEFPYQVFWLGEEYDGYKLTRVIPPDPEGWQEPTFFIYGGCVESLVLDCDPAFVVKSSPNCDPEARSDVIVRGRDVRLEKHEAVVETGVGSVYVYGRDTEARELVEALLSRGQEQSLATGDLPGSQCAYFRLRPRTSPTLASPEPYTPDPKAATIVSALDALGGVVGMQSYDAVVRALGWQPLRTASWRFTLAHAASQVGALRTLRNPLPMFEQRFHTVGESNPIHLTQEPESCPLSVREDRSTETIGPWIGESWTANGDSWFAFFSGEEVNGQRIRAVVWGPDFEPEALRHFVSTLTFD